MLYIFLSHYDNYDENVAKIKSLNENYVQQVYVEEYLQNPFKMNKTDIVYILNNSNYNIKLLELLDSVCYIINKNFYLKKYDKNAIQNILMNANIQVPKLLSFDDINKRSFPLMCKSKNHADFVIAMYTFGTYNNFFTKYVKNDFYLEQKINFTKEIKVYYVKDKTFMYENQNDYSNFKEISNICGKISKALDLQVFSADILICENEIYVIDVNPAAGLFNSTDSRKKLVEW